MIDRSSLFLHILAAVGMSSGGVVQVLAGFRVRGATSARDIAMWATFARQAGLLIAGSAVVSLMTGGHLAGAVWTTETSSGFSEPFITLGTIALVLLAPIGPMIGGAALRRLAAAADALDDGVVTEELASAAGASSLWGPVHSLPGLAIGFVAVMVYKPSWLIASVVLVGTFVAGWIGGVVISRQR